MSQATDFPVYIVDTNALYWYFESPARLSPGANAVFLLAALGEARIIVPAIVVAEFYYLTLKAGTAILPSTLIAHIFGSREFVFSELGQEQLEMMDEVSDVSEMHDRLIAAEALVHQAPIISSDARLRASTFVDVIW